MTHTDPHQHPEPNLAATTAPILPPTATPPISPTPPTIRGQMPAPRPAWPQVIGIIGIVFASLGLLFNGIGLLILAAGGNAFGVALDGIGWLIAVITSTLHVVLIAASIFLIQRRRVGARMFLGWSYIQLVWVPLSMIPQTMQGWEQMQAQANAQPGGPSIALMASFVGLGLLIGLLWGLTLPVVAVVIMNRRSSKAEIATWP